MANILKKLSNLSAEMKAGGKKARNARKNFLKENPEIEGFSVTNAGENISGSKPVQVKKDDNPSSSMYWGIKNKDGSYNFHLNPNFDYEVQAHVSGGGDILFNNNYNSGAYHVGEHQTLAAANVNIGEDGIITVNSKGKLNLGNPVKIPDQPPPSPKPPPSSPPPPPPSPPKAPEPVIESNAPVNPPSPQPSPPPPKAPEQVSRQKGIQSKVEQAEQPQQPQKPQQAAQENSDTPNDFQKNNQSFLDKVQQSLKDEKGEYQTTFSSRMAETVGEDGQTNKSLAYHLNRVNKNVDNFVEEARGAKTQEELAGVMDSYGIKYNQTFSNEENISNISKAFTNRAKANASVGDALMAHNVPQYAVGSAFVAGLAASVVTSDGKKSNADLYSSPY